MAPPGMKEPPLIPLALYPKCSVDCPRNHPKMGGVGINRLQWDVATRHKRQAKALQGLGPIACG